VKNFC